MPRALLEHSLDWFRLVMRFGMRACWPIRRYRLGLGVLVFALAGCLGTESGNPEGDPEGMRPGDILGDPPPLWSGDGDSGDGDSGDGDSGDGDSGDGDSGDGDGLPLDAGLSADAGSGDGDAGVPDAGSLDAGADGAVRDAVSGAGSGLFDAGEF